MLELAKKNKYVLFLGLLITLYIAYFSWFTILRHNAFLSDYYDLGIMDQTVYNTFRGRILELTDPTGFETIRRPAIHNDFILALLAPFYLVHAGPETLLIIQTVVLALGAIFVYKMVGLFFPQKTLALSFAAVYLMYPPLQWSNTYDFHGVTLATTFLLGFLYYTLKEKWWLSAVFLLLALSTKEQVALVAGFFGFYMLISYAKRSTFTKDIRMQYGLFVWFFSIVWFVIGIFVIIPYFREASHFALSRYEKFGENEAQVLLGILSRPDILLSFLFQPSTFNYLATLLFPFLFLPLATPAIFVVLPELLINLLSNSGNQRLIIFHYTAVITPILFYCALQGLLYLEKKRVNLRYIPVLLIFAVCISSFLFSPLPYSRRADTRPLYTTLPEKNAIELWKRILSDENISVSASGKIAPHFSNRKRLIRFGQHYHYAQYVVILKSEVQNDWLDYRATLSAYENLVQNPRYVLEYNQGDLAVYRRAK